jgi:KGK domain
MNDRFESLESGEVISVQHDTLVLSGHRTFRVGELNEAIESHLKKAIDNWNEENNAWFTPQGLDCEALRFGSQGWQKGRIRLCLEFCPDEPGLPAHGTNSVGQPAVSTNITAPSGQSISPPAPIPPTSPTAHHEQNAHVEAVSTPVISENITEPAGSLPLAGMTAMGAVAVAAAISIPVAATATAAAVTEIPHLADTTLELEEHPNDASMSLGGLDEFAFDFENDLGVLTPNGMMELDLTDLSLDFSDQDLLSFEQQGMAEHEEFINLQDIGKSENSGMLIDEVWNELNQGNWTGSN